MSLQWPLHAGLAPWVRSALHTDAVGSICTAGCLDLDELKDTLTKLQFGLERAMQSLDLDMDGKVTLREWLVAQKATFDKSEAALQASLKTMEEAVAESRRLSKVAEDVKAAQEEFELSNPLTKDEVAARVEASEKPQLFDLGGGFTLRYGYMSQRGYYPESLDKNNQDAFKVVRAFNGVADHLLLGVFDGHGGDGDGVSYFVRDHIEAELKRMMAAHPDDFEEAYKACFVKLNEQCKLQSFDANMSGTTAITSFFHGPRMTIANIGDSRAIVGERKGEKVMAYSLSIVRCSSPSISGGDLARCSLLAAALLLTRRPTARLTARWISRFRVRRTRRRTARTSASGARRRAPM
jgi:hypothetical protein